MKTTNRFFYLCTILICLFSLVFLPGETGKAAPDVISLSTTTPYTQNFSIGTSATATLPTDWRVSKDNANVRTVGDYASAVSATELRAGNSMSSSAQNGIYNYGAGVATTATDRAVGFLSSGTGTASGNLYAWFNNGTGNALGSVTISYNVEKYRRGFNPAGFSIQLYYSFDGVAWTSAGANFLTSFPADADNTGYPAAPGVTTSVTNQMLTVNIPNGSDFYLAWNYSVTSGSTFSSAQGLGIDDFSILGNAPTAVTLTGFDAAPFAGQVSLTWQTLLEFDLLGFNLYRCAQVTSTPDASCAHLNPALIQPQAMGSPMGASYSFVDSALLPGQSAYYWLETVNVDGRQFFGPLQVTGEHSLRLPLILRRP